uniref:Uncharacterized protein n=1 Tax=Panagrolaimus davidi TaxID=227884 RepID=A0A914PSG3_9BILA
MRQFLFALILWLSCNISFAAVLDPYSRRYNLRNSTFESLFPTTAQTAIQGLVNSAPVIDNTRCNSAYQFANVSTLAQLINFQYELIELCPIVYESIKYKNITTWGPVEEFIQIWYMRFIDSLWTKIQSRTSTCRCILYDDFISAAASDTVLSQYLQNNYDPAFCLVNDQTMYRWHLLLQTAPIKNRMTKFLKIGDFSIQLVQAIAKAYLTEDRYNSYFELPTNGDYPLLTYMNATLSSTNWTTSEKASTAQLRNFYKQQFPSLDLAGRQQLLLTKFSESIDLNYVTFASLNRIPLDTTDGITHYDLILYLSRKDFLIAKRMQYTVSTTTTCMVTTSTTTTTKAITTTTAIPSTTTTTNPSTTTTTKVPSTTTTIVPSTTTTSTTTSTTTVPSTTTTVASTTSTTTVPKTTTTVPSTTSTTTVPSTTSTTTVPSTTSTTTVPSTTSTTTAPSTTTTVPSTTSTTTVPSTTSTTTVPSTTSTTTAPSTTTTVPSTTSTTTIPSTTTTVQSTTSTTTVASTTSTTTVPKTTTTVPSTTSTTTVPSTTSTTTVPSTTSTTTVPSTTSTTTAPSTTTTVPSTTSTTTVPSTTSTTTVPSTTSTTTAPSTTTTVPSTTSTTTIPSTTTTVPSTTSTTTVPSTTTTAASTTSTTTVSSTTSTTTIPSTTFTTTAPSTTTTTIPPCTPPANTAKFFIETGVALVDNGYGKVDPVGNCATDNRYNYFTGNADPAWASSGEASAGTWDRSGCASPCICSDISCYTPVDTIGSDPINEPTIMFYPYCNSGSDCFIAAVLVSDGALTNPSNPTDSFTSDGQIDQDFNAKPVTDSSYLKATKIGCNGCPVAT